MPPDEYEQPRPLTQPEREILDLLLSVNVPGIEELREQAKTAQAVRWGPRDPSFALYVDQKASRPSRLRRLWPLIEAETKQKDGPEVYHLLLWVDDEGWLSSVEFYFDPWEDEEGQWREELLPASEFEPPFLNWSHGRPPEPASKADR